MRSDLRSALAATALALPLLAQAAEIDGSRLAAWWGIPFAGVLLSIAILRLAAPKLWHHHFGKIAGGWALAFLLPFAVVFGPGAAGSALAHTLAAEYIPFIALLTALFTAAGGIHIRGNLQGSPLTNVTTMTAGAVFMGANNYTGNAPNFMAKAIAEDCGIRMPSFFGYMARTGAVLLPLVVIITFIWFR